MMTSPDRRVTGGVDTHDDVHVAAVLDSATGRELDTRSFPTTVAGYAGLLAWIGEHGIIDRVGVESTGSWGAGLARHLSACGVEVIEVDRPDRKARRHDGKSDPTDAVAAARAALSGRASVVPKSRDGAVEAIRTLEIVYHAATLDRTRAINQFKALIVTAPDALRHRLRDGLSLTAQLGRARRFPDNHPDPIELQTRFALRELARRIGFLDDQNRRLEARIAELVTAHAPALLGVFGVGPHAAAQLLAAAGDNPHRLRSEAAFAKLCGVCPLPASSGKTTRHRLNRGGDRRANNALFHIVLVRMRHDPTTRAYVARRTAEGKTHKEIMRRLKRFVAREVFTAITNPPADLPTGAELRALRSERGLSLTTVSSQFATSPINISRIERGLTHDTRLARRIRDWLREPT
ncbi:MAG: IS110 family transposase [Acidobacteria bacterium]|nr:IS110 family transposase [Acidobacteriota bacterium]